MAGGDPVESALYKHSYKLMDRPPLSLSVYNTGMEQCRGGYCWGPGIRDHYLIHYVTGGRGTYCARGETLSLATGDMFLSLPSETIAYCADEEAPWAYCWVGFHGVDAASLLSGTDFAKDRLVLHFAEDEPRALLRAIYDVRGGEPYQMLQMTGNLYLFLAWLQAHASQARHVRQPPGEEYVQRARAFIANNYASPITIEDIAAHVGVSRSRLFRAFQEHMQSSPTRYLTNFRMDHARKLIRKGALSVKEIAYSVGFEDPLYFSRRFHEIHGCSPTAYAQGGQD